MKLRFSRKSITGGALVVVGFVALCGPGGPAGASHTDDALHRKVTGELQAFIDWLNTHNAPGFVGETGWPDDFRGEAAEWNDLAESWYELADSAELPAVVWATGEWWPVEYPLAVYEDRNDPEGVDTPNTQAPVFEAHLSTPAYQRGINVSTGTFCEGHGLEKTSTFSNRTPGKYGRCYIYDNQATYDFIAGRGIDVVKIEFRWEHVQRTIGGPLHERATERLSAVVGRARSAGLHVILSMHNFGAYWLWDGDQGVRRPIGTRRVPIRRYADVWSRLSDHFKDQPEVSYAIMSEPVGLKPKGELSARQVWEKASQAAIDAIRATGDTHALLVNGYAWSALRGWAERHPNPWIVDPSNNFFYTAHHYWDREHSGAYEHTYADEVAYAEGEGW